MRNSGLNLTEEQAWILRKVIEAAVQLLTNEDDIKKCVSLFEKWESGKVYLSLKKIRYDGHIYKCLLPPLFVKLDVSKTLYFCCYTSSCFD